MSFLSPYFCREFLSNKIFVSSRSFGILLCFLSFLPVTFSLSIMSSNPDRATWKERKGSEDIKVLMRNLESRKSRSWRLHYRFILNVSWIKISNWAISFHDNNKNNLSSCMVLFKLIKHRHSLYNLFLGLLKLDLNHFLRNILNIRVL